MSETSPKKPLIFGLVSVVLIILNGIFLINKLVTNFHHLRDVESSTADDNPGFDDNTYRILNEFGVLHPDIKLNGIPADDPETGQKELPLEQAVLGSCLSLNNRGIYDFLICETRWIAAPVGCYLVDGLFRWTPGDVTYRTFRFVFSDGSEGESVELAFLARGINEEGQVVWFPLKEGPDYTAGEGQNLPDEALLFEFLVDREGFESLENRFPYSSSVPE